LIIFILCVIIIISISLLNFLYQSYEDYEKKTSLLSQKKELLLEYENLTEPKNDNYRNPFYNESVDLINKYSSKYTNETISDIKKNSVRCGLVEIIMKNEFMYEIVVFETIDKGLCFFETKSGYRVEPEIGEKYVDCVYYQHNESQPYKESVFDDEITDILIIW